MCRILHILLLQILVDQQLANGEFGLGTDHRHYHKDHHAHHHQDDTTQNTQSLDTKTSRRAGNYQIKHNRSSNLRRRLPTHPTIDGFNLDLNRNARSIGQPISESVAVSNTEIINTQKAVSNWGPVSPIFDETKNSNSNIEQFENGWKSKGSET